MGFCCRWVFPTLGMTVLSGTGPMKCPSTTEPHIGFFFLHNTTKKLKCIYVVCLGKNTRVRKEFLSQAKTTDFLFLFARRPNTFFLILHKNFTVCAAAVALLNVHS